MMTSSKWIALLIIFVAILGVGTALWSKKRTDPAMNQQISCAQDARICPDGTFVSRVAPSCDFAACPVASMTSTSPVPPTATSAVSEPPIPTGWKEVSDLAQRVSYRYPEKLTTKYARAQAWPPELVVSHGKLSCTTDPRVVSGRSYCVHETSDGAAGSVYTEYHYTMAYPGGDALVTLSFTIQYPQCLNYDQPDQDACLQERSRFKIDELADSILTTVHFNSDKPSETVRSTTVSVDGVSACLPHRGDGPHTMECALGLKIDESTYYALDTRQLNSDSLLGVEAATQIHVTGLYTPIEMLSSNQWQKYAIKGIISADSVKINRP
jgi:hypothetical protein